MATLHLPHLPRIARLPKIDVRSFRHETLIAAGVALAAVALTASVRGRAATNDVALAAAVPSTDAPVTTPSNVPSVSATMAAAVATPSVASADHAEQTVRVAVPPGGTSRIRVIDAASATVATVTVGRETTRLADLPAGDYRVEVSNDGPIEAAGGVSISSATSVRTPAVTVAAGDVLTIVQDAAS